MHYTTLETTIGALLIAGDESGLGSLEFGGVPRPGWCQDGGALAEARRQLQAYFAGDLENFELPLNPPGTEFQREVWRALRTIPYGQTASYSEIADRLGRTGAQRAVGAANARNPLPVVVPGHRVVGKNGSLTGYAGGLSRKRALLELEARSKTLLQREEFQSCPGT